MGLWSRKQADRHNRRRKATQSIDEVQVPNDPGDDPADVAIHRDLAKAVRAAVAAISEPDRRLLDLRYLADWSATDLASVLAISEGAVRNRLHDARRRLKPRLAHLETTKESLAAKRGLSTIIWRPSFRYVPFTFQLMSLVLRR
jgi:RNA polymerase sigma-70 factor (ECF subfamily)